MDLDSGQNGSGMMNLSRENYTAILTKLNHERAVFLLPVVIVLGIVMVAAIIGNLFVIYVYRSRSKRTASSLFIMILACLDLLSSAVCIPFEIYDLSYPYMNAVPVWCKSIRFFETFINVSSGLTLTCIAFDRYFHICYPLKIYTVRQARKLLLVVGLIAMVLTCPRLILAGKATKKTRIEGILGEDCATQDRFVGSILSILFQGGLAMAFLVNLVLFFVFYGRIYFVIWRRQRKGFGYKFQDSVSASNSTCKRSLSVSTVSEYTDHGAHEVCYLPSRETEIGSDSTPSAAMGLSCQTLAVSSLKDENEIPLETHNTLLDQTVRETEQTTKMEQTIRNIEQTTPSLKMTVLEVKHLPHSVKEASSTFKQTTSKGSKIRQLSRLRNSSTAKMESRGASVRRSGTSRTTLMLTIVIVTGLVSFVPYLTVAMLLYAGTYFQSDMSSTEDLVYEFCTKSYFLNNLLNPIIYSILNPMFRKESMVGLKKLVKCDCRGK